MDLNKFITATIILITMINLGGFCQDSTKPELSLNLSYFNRNERIQFLQVTAKSKVKGKFQPVAGLNLQFYISVQGDSNLLGKSTTNDKGIATVYILPNAKNEWMKGETREFLAKSDSSGTYEATTATAEVTKSKIRIDTGADKKILATLLALKRGAWVPVNGVDMVIAVKRVNADLRVDQNLTHTTDSLGIASADFALTGLPGDSAGNITLIAKLEDNDVYGNISAERTVPWGSPTRYISDFNKRSLYARQGRSPIWLIFMAYSIGLTVWGVIIYLILQIGKIKKIGKQIA